ncbi:hypothetical protein M407DRAFT_29748 [Tulasnella calospora MUT 4182]|uniref:Uncharacterized protein n=1 Tax=Tulasnella calospora MUT 4182 TaxID=1051891 RepID=A0A0C3Q9I9_9AGAM|nr:hypothetical protein M407DRAFT_29748 [Tulasnella calospora MUT 4182]
MPLRNALLSLSALPKLGSGSTQPRAKPGSTDDTTVVWLPAEPDPINPADVIVIVVPVVFFTLLFAGIITAIVLKRREKQKQGRCSCRRNSRQRESSENTDLEALADGSGYALIARHSSESDNDSNSSQLELPLSTDARALDETSKGKSDVLDPPPYSER